MDLITNSQRVLLHLHPKPDPDSIGSALATYHALRSIGKEVTVIKGDSELSLLFSFLPGYDVIVKKNFFEISLNDFDLFIIQDSGSLEMVSREGEIKFPSHLRTLVIDHHVTNTKFAEINLVDASYAATSEYLFDHIGNNIVASTLITVVPWKIGISLIEKFPNQVAVSFRSKNEIDVSLFAKALGGGGHKSAAGAYLNCSLEEAKQKVLSVIHS